MDGGAWWAAVHGVARSGTRLSDFTLIFSLSSLEKEMATHSSVIAWRNINNLRYADDTTLMAESEEELKSLLMKVKVKSLSRVPLLATAWTAAHQTTPSMGLARQEY